MTRRRSGERSWGLVAFYKYSGELVEVYADAPPGGDELFVTSLMETDV